MLMRVTRKSDGQVDILLTDPDSHRALNVLNANAYPPECRRDVDLAMHQLAVLNYAARVIGEDMRTETRRMLDLLQNPREVGDIEHMVPYRPSLVLQNVGYFARLGAALQTAKSVLDTFARVIAQNITGRAQSPVDGFHKGKLETDAQALAGGSFLKWLARSSPKFDNKDHLIATVRRHVDRWINDMVKYRDDIVHWGEVRGASAAVVVLDRAPSRFTPDDVALPKMPDGKAVEIYCAGLCTSLETFVIEVSHLLPRVQLQYLPSTEAAPAVF
jgi:hypothetical protein